jgi:fructose-1,6-bisphosphatase/inositol monophosphatase family enzyme
VEEAGGRVTSFTGTRDIEAGTIIASNGALHNTIRERVVSEM